MFSSTCVAQRLPSSSLGSYITRLLERPSWIQRRVETVHLLDHVTARRHVTVDVNADEVRSLDLEPDILRHQSVRPLPIGVLRKGLLMDFDMRDSIGAALPVPTREEDSIAALSMMYLQSREQLGEDPTPEVTRRLFRIAHEFPKTTTLEAHESPARRGSILSPAEDWDEGSTAQWGRIVAQEQLLGLLRMFSSNFLLLARLADDDAGTRLFKFSYLTPMEPSPDLRQRIGIRPLDVLVPTESAGDSRSYHLRFTAPAGVNVVDARFERQGGPEEPGTIVGQSYRRLAPSRAHLYVRRPAHPSGYVARVSLRPPVAGFIRAALVSSVFTAAVLLAARLYLTPLLDVADTQAATAIPLLLAVPSALAAWVARPGEHALVGRTLLGVRVLVAVLAVLPYLAGGAIFLMTDVQALGRVLTVLSAVAVAVTAIILVSVVRTSREVAGAPRGQHAQPVDVRSVARPTPPQWETLRSRFLRRQP